VAEVLLIRQLCLRLSSQRVRKVFGKLLTEFPVRALLVLPYVSIVTEKTQHLQQVLAPMGAVVKGYFGAEQGPPPLSSKVSERDPGEREELRGRGVEQMGGVRSDKAQG
jgi:hypothetical protein